MMEELTKKLDMLQSCENIFNTPSYQNILSLIFRYLSCTDLETASTVCRLWSDITLRESVRRKPCALRGGCELHPKSSWDTIFSCIKESSVKPTVGLVFVPISTKGKIKRRIFDELSKHCETIILFLTDFITCDAEIEYPFYLACAFLPETPNVKINTVKITERNVKNNDYKEYVDMIYKASTQKEPSKLILFYNSISESLSKQLATFALQKELALKDGRVNWGIQSISINNEKEEDVVQIRGKKYYINMDCCIAILITGSIEHYEMFISAKYKTKEHIEKELKLFRNRIKLKRHSVGFEYSTLDDSYTIETRLMINHEIKLETMIFKTVFPEVPLIGIFESDTFETQLHSLERKYACAYQEEYNTCYAPNLRNKISTLHTQTICVNIYRIKISWAFRQKSSQI